MSINRYYIFIDRSFSSPTAREHQDTPTTTKGNFPRCDTVIIPDRQGLAPTATRPRASKIRKNAVR